ncbi:IS1096 element passenger TnpR family protein [Terrilactibacillus laevilacticus]|uniref:Plasmid pRiA4b Orf3-like domain-containing protein n=1 Tax=Terrilactibacillus laevilacticus TaxID=1380157 RepID=A0ABW5PUU9_9BACI|nr:hypothetical protein [Terrilactibacillus laevilacticus]
MGFPDEDLKHPKCIDGERQRPPKDVGGVGGYEEFLNIINDPNHEEYDEMLHGRKKTPGKFGACHLSNHWLKPDKGFKPDMDFCDIDK